MHVEPLAEPLLDKTYRLLDATPLSYTKIARGARVDKNWLVKLGQRDIVEPGVKKIQRVHDFLIAQPDAEVLTTPVPAETGPVRRRKSA